MQKLITLAIDTSCDETSAAVVENNIVLSNIRPSQMQMHKEFGGVVPSLAKLEHEKRINGVIDLALKRAGKTIKQIDFVAVTYGPGLAIALEVGINKAKELSIKNQKPLFPINHMEGHLLSGFAARKSKIKLKQQKALESWNSLFDTNIYPALGVLVSGGHTELIVVQSPGVYKKIAETQDDSCGEAFDKCGRIMGIGYPAGPVLSDFASQNRLEVTLKEEKRSQSVVITAQNKKTLEKYELPIPMYYSKDLNFSYSGLKTAFQQLVVNKTNGTMNLNKQQILDLSVLFEQVAFRQIEVKLLKALKQYNPQEVWLGGGVIANVRFRSMVRKITKPLGITMRSPFDQTLTTDNAAMIGLVSNFSKAINKKPLETNIQIQSLERDPSRSL